MNGWQAELLPSFFLKKSWTVHITTTQSQPASIAEFPIAKNSTIASENTTNHASTANLHEPTNKYTAHYSNDWKTKRSPKEINPHHGIQKEKTVLPPPDD
jgi:hypothetical protein